jgi:hypothetical protein
VNAQSIAGNSHFVRLAPPLAMASFCQKLAEERFAVDANGFVLRICAAFPLASFCRTSRKVCRWVRFAKFA